MGTITVTNITTTIESNKCIFSSDRIVVILVPIVAFLLLTLVAFRFLSNNMYSLLVSLKLPPIFSRARFENTKGNIFWLLSIWWKCPFALSKMPSYIPWQNALIHMPFSKRALWIREFWQAIQEGIFERAKGHFTFAL